MNPQNRLSNQTIDEFLKETHFKRIGEYKNNCTSLQFLCIKHNKIFETSWGNLSAKCKKGTGCSECVKEKLRLSNEIIDERLIGRNIKRIGNYITANEKIEWELDDGYRWFATPANVLTKTNFVKTRKSLTNEIIDERLKGREILRIGEYQPKSLSKIDFQCSRCNHKWTAIVNNVINKKYGCPSCSWGKEERYFKSFIEDNITYDSFDSHKSFTIRNKTVIPDFYIEKDNRRIIVEYNGIQHYKPIEYFGGISRFEKQVERDRDLREYCLEHNIELYELPYYINRDDNEKTLIQNLGGMQSL
jgi:hypothetical protein